MTQPNPIQAVIFDMDGLMIDTERIAQRAWQIAGKEGNYEFDDATYVQAIGRTRDDTKELFQTAFGPDFPFDDLYERKQQIMYDLIDTEGIPTMPGLFELYDLIDELGIAKAVATSTARPTALKKLTIVNAIDRFEVIVCGNEIPNGKPAPDIFLEAATRLGIEPQHCIVLEDSEAGIRAAHAANMTPIMIPDMKQPSDEIIPLAAHILPSLWDVQPLLRQMVTRDSTEHWAAWQRGTHVSPFRSKIWAVWRQDTHGSAFKIQSGLAYAEATKIVAEYEAKKHKQHYWVEMDSK